MTRACADAGARARRTGLRRLALWCTAIGLALMHSFAHANCSVTGTTAIPLGSKTSFDARVGDPSAGSGASGLSCTGILGLLASQYVYVSVSSKDAALTNAAGDAIDFEVATSVGGTSLEVGQISGNLATAGLLSFSGPANDVLLYVRLNAAGNVSSGVYTGTVTLRWHYATCSNVGALGICLVSWTVSPGVGQTCVLVCTLNTGSLPGAGLPVTVTVSLNIERDCRFETDDIDFGSAPFIDIMAPVSGQIEITCTKGETYTVGLSDGNYFDGGRRRMASGTNRLEYDVRRPGGIPWNASDQRAEQAAPAAGDVPEAFSYEAYLYPDQATPPVGDYFDSLIIDVRF
jgi:spore coat protein U-like protein